MDSRQLTEVLLKLADRFNIPSTDLKVLVLKVCVLSLKFIDRDVLWGQLFGKDYVDWGLVNTHTKKENILGPITSWLHLLNLMSWNDLQQKENILRDQYPMLTLLRKHLRDSKLDPGGADGWSMTCKVKLLMMIMHIPTSIAIDQFSCAVFKRNTHEQSMSLLSLQAEHLYTPIEQLGVMRYMLENCKVDTVFLEQNVLSIQRHKEDIHQSLQLSRMQVIQGRPRLRDKLSQDKVAKAKSQLLLNEWDHFAGFCYKHQFPPTLSDNVKHKLYFLACQTNWDWMSHVHKILPSAPQIVAKVKEYPIAQPEHHVLIRVIEGVSMEGRPPFPLLNLFRSRCFLSFAQSQVENMSYTQFLQLYLTVYQPGAGWKDIWKHLVGVLSVQIIKDCQKFTKENHIDEEAVMDILVGSNISVA